MSYRPDNWAEIKDNCFKRNADLFSYSLLNMELAFEASADAMLEANRPLFEACLRILLVYKFPASEDEMPLVKQLQERIGDD